jgi:hypothetical protein
VPHILEGVLQLNLFGNSHTVIDHGRRAKLLAQRQVAPLGTKCHLDGLGQGINASLQGMADFSSKRICFAIVLASSFASS